MKRQVKAKIVRYVSVFLLVNMAFQLLAPLSAYALTSGPTTPEVQAFTPAGTSDMVQLFTGKLNYNIPLFELPGPNGSYPFNLAYNQGIGMDQEASWVGLGWNVNPGAINRVVRGLPDDFDGSRGDRVINRQHMKPNWTVGVNASGSPEIFGADFSVGSFGLSLGGSIFYNSYKGIGISTDVGLSFHFGNQGKEGASAGLGLNLSQNSQEGATLKPSLSLTANTEDANENMNSTSISASVGFNTRRGLSDLSIGMQFSQSRPYALADGKTGEELAGATTKGMAPGFGGSSSISFAASAGMPVVSQEMTGGNVSLSFQFGPSAFGLQGNFDVGGYFTDQHLLYQDQDVYKTAYGYLYTHNTVSTDPVTALARADNGGLMDFNREKDGMIRGNSPNLSIPNHTFDIYNISGQGVGGMFRAHRTHNITLADPDKESIIGGGALGFKFGAGEDIKVGVNGSINITDTKSDADIPGGSGPFTRVNNNPKYWSGNSPTNSDYELTYFKVNGEYTVENKADYSNYMSASSSADPKAAVDPIWMYGNAPSYYVNRDAAGNPSTSTRRPRNTDVEYFTFEQVRSQNASQGNGLPECNVSTYVASDLRDPLTNSSYPVAPYNYDLANPPSSTTQYHPFTSNGHNRDQHIGSFTVLQPDGSRYVYALPVYNYTHVEKMFSTNVDYKNLELNVGSSSVPSTLAYNSGGPNDYCTDASSDQYLSRTVTNDYTSAHLLTAILGTDYVDVDGNGPSDNDFGHWVKFNYVRINGQPISQADATSPFKWRAPFEGINFNEGLWTKSIEDKKASVMYGTKEVYYLASAETKTHIAVFSISPRSDSKGVSGENQHQGMSLGANSYKLDQINLYSKDDYYTTTGNGRLVNTNALPLTTAHFAYSYELCGGIPNFDPNIQDKYIEPVTIDGVNHSVGSVIKDAGSGGAKGKLTLRKLWFTYENSTKGKFNPYDFYYCGASPSNGYLQTAGSNPQYDRYSVDRWGNYKNYHASLGGGHVTLDDQECPYVNQYTDPLEQPYITNHDNYVSKATLDQWAAAWNMTSIQTPSGSTIGMQYETDDYAYVQNKVAGVMTSVYSTGFLTGTGALNESPTSNLYNCGGGSNTFSNSSSINGCPLYFNLQSPISSTDPNANALLAKYFTGLQTPEVDANGNYIWELYYKVKLKLRSTGEEPEDYVSGYATFQNGNWGFDPNSKDLSGNYTRAYVALDPVSGGGISGPYHPIARAGWEFLQSMLPDIASQPGNVMSGDPSSDPNSVAMNMLSAFGGFISLFVAFDGNACRSGWSNQIDLNHSWIRLSSPTRTKYGGGARVKQLVLTDSWNSNTQYGVNYKYTTTDADGSTISSGVASYEPIVGGDEISLRYARNFTENVPLKTSNNLYFEYPINESSYPAASVGYSKVTVTSLPASTMLQNYQNSGQTPIYSRIPSTGLSVNEFYTARDFPVIWSETPINNVSSHTWVPLLFLGNLRFDNITASQGYKVELNDMHGKPKKVTHYSLASDGSMNPQPVSWVQYDYQSNQVTNYDGTQYYQLNNDVKVLTTDAVSPSSSMELGVDYDFYTDMRHYNSASGQGGLDFNADDLVFGPIVIPAFVPWPNASFSQTEVTSQTSNKVIQRSGILSRTSAYDGGSTVTTQNKMYDALTGRVLLTSVTNDFDVPIYKYNMPAHWDYDGMSAASQNWNMKVSATVVSNTADDYYDLLLTSPATTALYAEGDELMCNVVGGTNYKATVIRKGTSNDLICSFNGSGPGTGLSLYLTVSRSGRRNLLSTDIGNITAKSDPTVRNAGNNITCSSPNITINVTQKHVEINPKFVNVLKVINALCETSTSITGHNTWNEVFQGGNPSTPYSPPRYNVHQSDPQPDLYKMSFNQFSQVAPYHNSSNTGVLDVALQYYPYYCGFPQNAYSFSPAKMDLNLAKQYVQDYNSISFNVFNPYYYQGLYYNFPFQPIFSYQEDIDYYNSFDINSYFWDIISGGFSSAFYARTSYDPNYSDPNNPNNHTFGQLRAQFAEPEMGPYIAGEPLASDPFGTLNPPVAGNADPAYYSRVVDWGVPVQSGQKQLSHVGTVCSYPAQSSDDIILASTQVNDPVNKNVFIKFSYGNGYGSTWASASEAWGGCIPATRIVSDNTSVQLSCTDGSVYSAIDKVLSASAVRYKDSWSIDFNDVRFPDELTANLQSAKENLYSQNYFANGQKGIFRPYANYVYVENRTENKEGTTNATGTLTGVDISNDGVFNNMPTFGWQDPFFDLCFDKWRLTNTITEYSPYGYELENKNILNQYSSALYSYKGKLATAVAGNAQLHEIATEGFEEYNIPNTLINTLNSSTGNFTFWGTSVNASSTATPTTAINSFSVQQYTPVNILFAQGSTVMLDMKYTDFVTNYPGLDTVKIEAIGAKSNSSSSSPCNYEDRIGKYAVSVAAGSFTGSGTQYAVLTLSAPAPGFSTCNDRCWTGKVYLPYTRAIPSATYSALFTPAKAHTGKISMEIPTGTNVFPQYELNLKPGKYVFSAWMSSYFTDFFPLNYLDSKIASSGWNIGIDFGVPGSTTVTSHRQQVVPIPGMEPIEGWRRITQIIDVPAMTPDQVMNITLSPYSQNGITLGLYFDDFRIEPFDASLKTYVYNPLDYKLKATLDDNNHAAIYSYDAQGNLFLVKKETQKGIKTIQESRSNIERR